MRHNRVHTAFLHSYKILEQANSSVTKESKSDYQGVGKGAVLQIAKAVFGEWQEDSKSIRVVVHCCILLVKPILVKTIWGCFIVCKLHLNKVHFKVKNNVFLNGLN